MAIVKMRDTRRNVLVCGIIIWAMVIGVIYWISYLHKTTKTIHKAAEKGEIADVQREVEKGVPVDVAGPYGRTPLSIAISNRHIDVAKYLVRKGASVQGKLLDAISLRDAELVKIIVERGARVEPDCLAKAIGSGSISGNDTDLIDVLLKSGACVDAQSRLAYTPYYYRDESGKEIHPYNCDNAPLHMAAFRRDVKLVKFLVGRGAKVNARNGDGETPLQIALTGYTWYEQGGAGDTLLWTRSTVKRNR